VVVVAVENHLLQAYLKVRAVLAVEAQVEQQQALMVLPTQAVEVVLVHTMEVLLVLVVLVVLEL
jgi:hypothetical protein